MKKAWKMKILALLVIGLFLVGAASCEIVFISHIRIVNPSATSDYEIWEVNIVPAGYPTWGSNLLGSSGTIYPTGDFDSFEVDPGNYDVRVIDERGLPFSAEATNVIVFEGDTISLYYDDASAVLY